MLRRVSNYSSSRYRYYVVQAYHGLKAIAGDEQLLLKPFISPGHDPGS